MNINGNDGPTLKNVFTCKNCKFLINAVLGSKKPYKCFNDDNIKNYHLGFSFMLGDIGDELITPDFCPFLIKKMRTEKLKELDEYRRTEEKIA